VRVEADPKMLRQVVFNFVLNAVQAMPAGGAIHIAAHEQDGGCDLEISDNGPGIAPEHREKIFQPYFTTREKEGTGLGLAIVRQVCLAHGWEVGFQPNEPAGARFRITGVRRTKE
jgi:two-component system sensor histidine kinase HydH